MNPFVMDLRFAQQARKAVELEIYGRRMFLTGVHEINEEKGWALVYAPKVFG